MLKPIDLFLLLYLINQSINEGVNFELACTNIYYASKKDCSVAPWSNNHRCCYINYEYNGKKEGECGWVYDSEVFCSADYKEFEGFVFPVPVGYDHVLKTIYGDYITYKLSFYVTNLDYLNNLILELKKLRYVKEVNREE